MPGKYSHAVVLAQQSSRGLISLSNEQYVDYLKSSPLISIQPPPHRAATAPPRNRSRATTSTNGSDRLPIQIGIRQQYSSDQLSASAYRHHASNGRAAAAPRRIIGDSDDEEEDDYSDWGARSEIGQRRQTALPNMPRLTYRNPTGASQRLPAEIPQQTLQHASDSTHSDYRRRQDQPPHPHPKADHRPSIELPIQIPADYGVLSTPKTASAALMHNRDRSNPKSLTTPQLSPTSTDTTHQEDEPATPFSASRRGATPAMVDEHKPQYSRDTSAVVHDPRLFGPGLAELPSQANFDGFDDETEIGRGFFMDVPEPAVTKKVRLKNMGSDQGVDMGKNLPTVPNDKLDLELPQHSIYHNRLNSLSTLSSLSDFGMGVPSVSQTTGKPKTSAAAMTNPEIILQEAPAPSFGPPAPALKKLRSPPPVAPPAKFTSAATEQKSSRLSIPIIPKSNLNPDATTSLSYFLQSLESRFDEPDIAQSSGTDASAAAPPPDIARYPPPSAELLMSQLVVDSRGGVSNGGGAGALQQSRGRSGTGVLRGLRIGRRK